MKFRATGVLCVLVLGRVLAQEVVPSEVPPIAPRSADSFDCVDAFDVVAAFSTLQCGPQSVASGDALRLRTVGQRLLDIGQVSAQELSRLTIEFCPLGSGTGIVPANGQIYLDDGLRLASDDGIAEVLAHEITHTRQFSKMGAREFKCAYVRAMAQCGGCQDRRHALEREAYAVQDEVRRILLAAQGIKVPERAPAP